MDKVSQIGIVRKVEDNSADIEIARSTSCGEKCSTCSGGCSGTGIIIRLDNHIGAEVGDIVRVESKTSNVVGSALFVYLLPVIMMVLGMVYGSRFAQTLYPGVSSDVAGLFFGFISLVVFYFLLKSVDRWLSAKNSKKPAITKILNR